MKYVIELVEKLLQSYERTTMQIDQGLVDRVQVCLKFCRDLQKVGL